MMDGRFKKIAVGVGEKGFPVEGAEQGSLRSGRLLSWAGIKGVYQEH